MEPGYLITGRYRLLDRLGAGGTSVVWRAHDEVLDRDVAVKLLSRDLAADPHLAQHVRLEARAAAGLRHPNVVEVYDYGQTRDDGGPPLPYVVMELVDGRSLAQLLTGGALPWRLAVTIGAQVAAALAAAHDRGVVHRDVKPGNVMVTAAGVKLVDFGISAAAGEADGWGGQVFGTPAYLAPERLDGGPVRAATDVYALGLLLYQALAGRLPWQASTITQMLTAHRYQEPATLPPLAELPPEVVELCRRSLSKRPGDRPPASEAAEILCRAAGIAPATLMMPGTHPDRSSTTVPAAAVPYRRGRARVTAGGPATRPLESATGRWGQLPRVRRTVLALAGVAAVLLSGGVAVSRLSGDAGPDSVQALAESPAVVAVGMGQRSVECSVRYAVRRAVNGRYSAAITISNTGTTPIPDWRLTFTLPEQQRLIRGWTGVWQQAGRAVHAHGGDLPAGASAATGFDATYRTAAALPTLFQVNGTPCQSTLSVTGQTLRTAATNGKDDKKDQEKEKDEHKDEHKDDD